MKKRTLNFWLYLFGIVATLCAGIDDIPMVYKNARLAISHETTTGVVVGAKKYLWLIFISTPKNPPRIIEYTVEGQTYQVESLIQGGRRPAYEQGQQVEVLYVPQNPAIAQINGEQGLATLLILPSCLVPLVLFPLLLLEVRKSRKALVENSSLKQ